MLNAMTYNEVELLVSDLLTLINEKLSGLYQRKAKSELIVP